MNIQIKTPYFIIITSLFVSGVSFAQPSPLPQARYNSQINPSDYVVTQEKRGEWSVNCRQRIYPDAGQKRCSATDGRQILKFNEASKKQNKSIQKPVKNNIKLSQGYILQLAAFSSAESAERFKSMYPEIKCVIISTTVQNIHMFNVITPVIADLAKAKQYAQKTSETIGYLPWIRTSDSI